MRLGGQGARASPGCPGVTVDRHRDTLVLRAVGARKRDDTGTVSGEQWSDVPEPDETAYAQGRLAGRTYMSRPFSINRVASSDYGQPARFLYKVLDRDGTTELVREGDEWTVYESPGGRVQVKVLVCREDHKVKEVWIQRVPVPLASGTAKTVLHLTGDEAQTLADFFRAVDQVPMDGDLQPRVDDSLLREVLGNEHNVSSLYQQDPAAFRELIKRDESAQDVVALAHRRSQVAKFRRLIEDQEYFKARSVAAGGVERVWQQLFETNPWLLGANLQGQLLVAWDEDRLEQVVTGATTFGVVGKRTDALMRTAGRVRAMVLAEIKPHDSPLLEQDAYRSGCWAPSREVTRGVAQATGTIHRVATTMQDRVASLAEDGSDLPGDLTYLIRPRSFLIIGNLAELIGERGGDHVDRIRSFELYRRTLTEPEIITYDEVLARAEWLTSVAE